MIVRNPFEPAHADSWDMTDPWTVDVRYGYMKVVAKDATEPLTVEQMRELIRQ